MLIWMENGLLRVVKTPSSLNGAKAIDGRTGDIASPGELCPSTTGHRFGAVTYQGAEPGVDPACWLGWLVHSASKGGLGHRVQSPLEKRAVMGHSTALQEACLCKSCLMVVVIHASCRGCIHTVGKKTTI